MIEKDGPLDGGIHAPLKRYARVVSPHSQTSLEEEQEEAESEGV